jgi:DNA uptake protein ComE-like DNA-binding protein
MNRNQEALAMVAQQNGKHAEARQPAAADPMSARQRGIGRRNLPERRYDDGGLIDINRVPAEIFTHFSGITSDKAAHIIIVRDGLGGAFSSIEELMATADFSPHLADEIAEYAIVISEHHLRPVSCLHPSESDMSAWSPLSWGSMADSRGQVRSSSTGLPHPSQTSTATS